MTDKQDVASKKTWREKIDWWELFVTLAPILAGLGIVAFLSVLDLIFKTSGETDWNQRILLGIAGIIVGISLQFKGISKEFKKLKNQSDKNSKKLAVELSEAIGIPVKSALSDSSSIRRTYRIAEKANRIDKNLEHLTAETRAIIRHWSDTYLSSVDSTVSDFARHSASFDGIRGLEADEDLISKAQTAVLASTPVTRESIEFWVGSAGKKYRESLTSLLEHQQTFKEAPEVVDCAGVARVFTFSSETITAAENGDESAILLFGQAINEAKIQDDMGVGVRLLMQADVSDDDLAELDVLIVDGCICSKTINQDPVNTRARSVVINWDRSGVHRIASDWGLIWRRASSIEDFMKDDRLRVLADKLGVKTDPIEEIYDNA